MQSIVERQSLRLEEIGHIEIRAPTTAGFYRNEVGKRVLMGRNF